MARYMRQRGYRGRRPAPQKRNVFSNRGGRAPRAPREIDAEGCIKIVVGRNRVRVWNNCGEPITIEDTLQVGVVNIYTQQLSGGGKALVIFGDPTEGGGERGYGRTVRNSANEESDYGDIPDDVEKWI